MRIQPLKPALVPRLWALDEALSDKEIAADMHTRRRRLYPVERRLLQQSFREVEGSLGAVTLAFGRE